MTFEIDEHSDHDIYVAPESHVESRPVPDGFALPRRSIQWVRYCRDCEEVID